MAQSEAAPIVYTFSGIGSGSVGASHFNDAAFSINLYSDTASVSIVGFTGGRNIYSAEASSATFTISGIGSGTFLQGTRVFDSQGIQTLGLSLSTALGGTDLWDFNNAAFFNYDLRSSFGSVDASPTLWSANLTDQPTTLGNLSFDAAPNITFSASIVPEPSVVALCGLGLSTFLGLTRPRCRTIRLR